MHLPTQEQIAEWYGRIYRTALRLTGRHDDAGDLAQETFCRALAHWRSFDGSALPTTWLHRILVNAVRDRRRRSGRADAAMEAWAILPVPRPDGPAEDLERREQLEHLRQAIDDLPATLRPAFVATVLDGYTYEEAAELLSAPPGTIASRVHQARRLIKAAMRDRFPET